MHVYIRVGWLNRPEDLDKGIKTNHGKNELIPTNQMDVFDAMAVNGSLEVVHWDEKDDDSALMHEVENLPTSAEQSVHTHVSQDQYFWRQTYDFANTKTFSVRGTKLNDPWLPANQNRTCAKSASTMRRRTPTR